MRAVPKRSPGLRKFVPQPDRYAERYGRFALTARDLAILDLVHRYRYVEARHVRALIGGSDQQITRRLQGLFHNRYVGRYGRRERMRTELDLGAPLIAYGLELKGARTLQAHHGRIAGNSGTEPEPVRWKKDYTRRTEWFLEHHLMISDFRCNLELALRATPDTALVTWDQSQETWFRVTIPDKRKRIARVAPDAYFVLREAEQLRHFFLEIDRSTEEHRRLVEKFKGYWWYLQDPRFTEPRGGRPRVTVLFVTTGERRLTNIVETLRRMPKPNRAGHGGKGIFRVLLETDWTREGRIAFLGGGKATSSRGEEHAAKRPTGATPDTWCVTRALRAHQEKDPARTYLGAGIGATIPCARGSRPMLLKVRPFPKQRTTYDTSAEIAGTVESGRFVLSVDDIPYSIDAIEVGIDDRGAYAVVEEGRRLLLGGWVLCVEAERSVVRTGSEPSCEITFRKQPDRERLEKAVVELGIGPPEAAALFRFGEGAIAISFDPEGVFESAIAVLGRPRS